MNVTARSTGAWQHTLEVEVPAEEVGSHLEAAAVKVQRRAALPGFRRGRVPLDMVRQHFGDLVESEFLDEFIPRAASAAVAEAKLTPVVPPLVRNLRLSPGMPLTFEAVVDVRPEVEATNVKGIPVRRNTRVIDDAEVERVLDQLREDSAVFDDLDRPAERGDVVLLDSTRLDANGRRLPSSRAKNRRIELGAPGVLPDLENGLLGAVAGQERTFDVHYPADYPAAELAGKTARYVVKIRKIQEKKLRSLDDNLARDVFRTESLADLKSRIRANLEGEERNRMQREIETAIVDELIRRNPVAELPERLVGWTLERVIHEATEGAEIPEHTRRDLETRFRPGVERSLRREVLLDAVARQQGIEVSDADVAEEIDRMAQAEPRAAARVRTRYASADRRQALRESLRERKALEWLLSVAEVREGEATPLVVPASR